MNSWRKVDVGSAGVGPSQDPGLNVFHLSLEPLLLQVIIVIPSTTTVTGPDESS